MCENSKFEVYFAHLIDPLAGEVPDFLVVSPKQKAANLVTGVAVLPLWEQRVGLVQVYRPPIETWSWEIPHGFIDPGEEGETAAVRELMEETGLIVDQVESLGCMTPDAGILAGRVQLYLASAVRNMVEPQSEPGLREFRWVSCHEFERMIISGQIQDGFTLSAWCRYLLSQ